jgi:hypothetical protein
VITEVPTNVKDTAKGNLKGAIILNTSLSLFQHFANPSGISLRYLFLSLSGLINDTYAYAYVYSIPQGSNCDVLEPVTRDSKANHTRRTTRFGLNAKPIGLGWQVHF